MKKIVLAFMLMLVSLSSAYALDKGGMFFEPMLTYETTDTGNVNFPAPT